ncbi:MAG: ferrous iron transport protein B [Firmicutes bacterium]|jgi:ferrous iron transport protein B|nr:ferrous iron transport protein B [Bacillota bacterium]
MGNIKIALAGNPNCGKTTLFNILTGANHYVGNWAGVTVEKKSGFLNHEGNKIEVLDLPGIYSLSPFTIEEKVTRKYIIDEKPDVVINIVDGCNLERNLYLTTQILELNVPVILAVNMMDEVEKQGLSLDLDGISKDLGIAVIPISASKNQGIDKLLDNVVRSKDAPTFKIDYGVYEKNITEVMESLPESRIANFDKRWLGIKILERDEEIIESFPGNEDENLSDQFISLRYEYITGLVNKRMTGKEFGQKTFSDKVDEYLLNKYIGLPLFLVIMAFVFYITFNVGNVFVDKLDGFFSGTLAGFVRDALTVNDVAPWLVNLVSDGIIGGVGGVLVFVPNIAILFIAISFLEDSGYMARVSFLMDYYMQKVGLNGKTFIPMILGFGCNVPAIMGTRTLENERDRLIAILINPFMSCGARFPVYVMFAGIFFKGYETLVVTSLYVLGIIVALVVAYIFRKTIFKGEGTHFIMEMPAYRLPNLKSLAIHVWERVKGYIAKAGTVIFAASIIIWFITNYNMSGMAPITESFGASLGKIIAPVFAPMGFGNWQSALSLLSGIFAKEIVVANMAIVFGFSDPSLGGFGQVLMDNFTQLSAYAFMVFVLLYTPCVATIGVIKRETNSWKWTFFSLGYQIAVAWIVSFAIYSVGRIFLA